ncbi:hypothetical protein MYX84_14370 [Acidobacteria bacterium AH-259-O06]|nr:hypothetical protein [Acidobacteria bacterium AH-259-O06]
MYIDIVPNRSSPPAVLLRESFREGKKIRKRTLANLSHLDALRVEALRRALRGEFDHLTSGQPVCGPIFGVLYVLKKIAEALGIPQVLGRHRLARLGLFLILARVAHQGSRLSSVRWARRHAVAEVLGLEAFERRICIRPWTTWRSDKKRSSSGCIGTKGYHSWRGGRRALH